ncbi:MAG: hypothetical protein WCQ99_08195 [Pseudomonadota bacterium]
MMGFTIDGLVATVTGTAISGSVSNISLTYNTFKIGQKKSEVASKQNKAKGISVDNDAKVYNLAVRSCVFTGQPTNTSNWFYVGNYGNGGSAGNVILSNNTITDSMSTLYLSQPITKTQYLNNTFSNNWTRSGTSYVNNPYGYVLINGASGASSNLRGITLTHNTFNNSSVTDSNEFGVLIADNVLVSGSNWKNNLAIHKNNFLQQDYEGFYPIAGFQDASISGSETNQISATANWWNATSGPRIFITDTGTSSTSDVSSYAGKSPWDRAQNTGGSYVELAAINAIQEITGTQILNTNMSLQVRTTSGGVATLIPTKYSSAPTPTTGYFTNGLAYFDLGIKSGSENIGAITATFYVPSSMTMASPYLYFYNGSKWAQCSSFARKQITSTSLTVRNSDVSSTWLSHSYGGAVTYVITSTKSYIGHITPTLYEITRTSINTPTRTFFALVGTGGATTTSTAGTSTTTTASSSSSSGTSTSTSSSSSTTTSTLATTSTPATTTSAPKTTTTSTATSPKLTVNPSKLSFADNETEKQITISNTGSGSLTWSIQDNATSYTDGRDWIFSAKPKSGLIKTTPEDVTVTVSRKGIEKGTYAASLPIISNGGNRDLAVSMEVSQSEAPLLGVSTQLVLLLGKDETTKTITIFNLGTGSLTWEVETPIINKGEGWLTVSPPSGYALTQAELTVTVKKDGIRPGLYSATIPVRSNAGTKNITVAMLVYDGPVIRANPFVLIFLSKTATENTFTLSNAKAGTITWEAGTPEYFGASDGWIKSISPSSGVIEADQAEVTVKVSRDTLTTGLYRASIPITSNGGNVKVITYLFVNPFF